MRLTKAQRLACYKACIAIQSGRNWFSCPALGDDTLKRLYRNFYGRREHIWPFSNAATKDGRNERLIALLFFAEVHK